MTRRYFISGFVDGSVSHLVRITETDTTLVGEYYIDGAWVEDGSAMEYLYGGTAGEEIDEQRARKVIAAFGLSEDATPPTGTHDDGLRNRLRSLLPDDAPRLPEPIPAGGVVSGNDWTVRFALNADDDGGHGLDFYAENPYTSDVHGRIDADGSVTLFDVMESEFSYDPEVEDRDEAEARQRAHNARVTNELVRKGLL
jgi:hypothetical protein